MENNIIKRTLRRELEDLIIHGLTKREQIVLKLRGKGKTLQFIGDKFGVSRERIRINEKEAKAKLDYFLEFSKLLWEQEGRNKNI